MDTTGPITTSQKLNALLNAVPPRGQDQQRPQPPQRLINEQAAPSQANESDPAGQSGVYIISVAARILSMHPQTLRKYERVGLVRPSRTVGMLRLYSDEDIAKLRMIKHLVDEQRLNLAGVEMALAVFDRLLAARRQMTRSATSSSRVFEQTMQDILALLQGRQGQSGNKEQA
jgi:MerR family transcriptional regulator, heat shock protein HspR